MAVTLSFRPSEDFPDDLVASFSVPDEDAKKYPALYAVSHPDVAWDEEAFCLYLRQDGRIWSGSNGCVPDSASWIKGTLVDQAEQVAFRWLFEAVLPSFTFEPKLCKDHAALMTTYLAAKEGLFG